MENRKQKPRTKKVENKNKSAVHSKNQNQEIDLFEQTVRQLYKEQTGQDELNDFLKNFFEQNRKK